MAALSLLPLWALMYARALTAAPEQTTGPLGIGAKVYANCASCHLDSGEGSGPIYGFINGGVIDTFPNIEDQLRWIYFGTDAYTIAGIEIYGNPQRGGGPHITGDAGRMPGWGDDLTDAEILAVTCHERYTFAAPNRAKTHVDEFNQWCSDNSAIFADLEAGGDLATLHTRVNDIIPIGAEPAAGSPPTE